MARREGTAPRLSRLQRGARLVCAAEQTVMRSEESTRNIKNSSDDARHGTSIGERMAERKFADVDALGEAGCSELHRREIPILACPYSDFLIGGVRTKFVHNSILSISILVK
jgi:hypothetical protein